MLLHGGKISRVIGHQAENSTSIAIISGLEFFCGDREKFWVHQTPEPMTAFRPGIRKGDMQRVKKGIGDQGVQ